MTDDYGVQLDRIDSLSGQYACTAQLAALPLTHLRIPVISLCPVTLAVVDSATGAPIPSLTLTPNAITLTPAQSPFHKVRVTLAATGKPGAPLPPTFRLLLAVVGPKQSSTLNVADKELAWMQRVLGEEGQDWVEDWDGTRYLFLRGSSGCVEVRRASSSESTVGDAKGL